MACRRRRCLGYRRPGRRHNGRQNTYHRYEFNLGNGEQPRAHAVLLLKRGKLQATASTSSREAPVARRADERTATEAKPIVRRLPGRLPPGLPTSTASAPRTHDATTPPRAHKAHQEALPAGRAQPARAPGGRPPPGHLTQHPGAQAQDGQRGLPGRVRGGERRGDAPAGPSAAPQGSGSRPPGYDATTPAREPRVRKGTSPGVPGGWPPWDI